MNEIYDAVFDILKPKFGGNITKDGDSILLSDSRSILANYDIKKGSWFTFVISDQNLILCTMEFDAILHVIDLTDPNFAKNLITACDLATSRCRKVWVWHYYATLIGVISIIWAVYNLVSHKAHYYSLNSILNIFTIAAYIYVIRLTVFKV